LVPDPDQVRLQFRAALEAGAAPPLPYWTRIWPAAEALAAFVTERPELVAGKDVLELAAGLGLPGLAAARFARQVTLSDYLPEAVTLLQENAGLQPGAPVQVRLLDWNALPADLHPEVLLLSDINYDPAAFTQLQQVLLRFLSQGTTILLATPERLMARRFVESILSDCRYQETRRINDTPVTLMVLERPHA